MSKLKINRFFCKENGPYDKINFITTANTIKNADGSIAMHWDNLVMPDIWESLPINIMARNYLRKKGIPKKLQKKHENGIYDWLSPSIAVNPDEDTTCETDARQVFDRLAGAWTYWGVKGGYFDSEEDAKNFYDEIRYMLVNQMAAPNSPQWFNTGLHWAYGIEGNAQGHYFFNEETQQIEQSSNAYYRPQPHACFIQSIKDSLVEKGGILDLVQREALLFKYGSGTGTNFSALRGKGEKLSGGGTSSGLMSFLKIGDVAAGSIKSGGTTRRAAKMVILDIDHPEIIEFIQWKNKEEEKVLDFFVGAKKIKEHTDKITKAFENKSHLKDAIENATAEGISTNYLIKLLLTLKNGQKYEKQTVSLDWNANAYDNIFGQNSNNSVRISDDFINSVIHDKTFDLKFRTTGETYKTLKSRSLWDEIANAAWGCADPGIQFDTTINDWHTCPNSGRINGSNPCSEYMFLDDTACNLASLNLIKFVKNNEFDTESFIHACKLWTIVLEISVYMAQFPSETIALQSYQFRTLGLGYGNLGALLMQQGIAYDSDEGRNTAAGITALMQGIAYKTSAEMAKFLGSFEKFNDNQEEMIKVIKNHRAAISNNNDFKDLHIIPQLFNKDLCIFKNINEIIMSLWNEVVQLGEQYGYRNAQVSVIAPTGTIGIVMGFKTTGVEPLFAQIVYKPLSGGGMMKLINDDIDIALHNLKYTENEIKDICNYVTGYYSFNGPIVCNTEFLKSQGITEEEITLVEKELSTSFEVQQAFKILPESFFIRLSLSKNNNILEQFKLTELEIEEANLYCCGNMTIEGAPHLKDEHIKIFDCCLPSGKGTRSLSYQSHIQMMAAIQPFLSGAISKTINLPNMATIKDCQNAYLLAWQLGLKSVALYRDGSKYSQVLNTSTNKELFEEFYTDNNKSDNLFSGKGYSKKIMINNQSLIHTVSEDNEGIIRNVNIDFGKEGSTLKGWVGAWSTILSLYLQKKGTQALFKTYKAFKHSKFEPMGNIKGHNKISYANSIPDYIVKDLIISYPNALNIELQKNTLPYQREGKINKIKIGQETLYLIIGEDQTGLPCEVFVAGMGNEGSDLKGWMNSCAKLLSLYFQDCKTEAILTFIEKFENSSFNPSGLVIGHDTIKFVSSPLDFLAKYLKHKYEYILSLTQTQLLNLPQDKTINTIKQHIKTQRIIVTGYLDEACKVCKAFKLKSNGSCYVCEACGSTTGCS